MIFWTTLLSYPYFYLLNKAKRLRVSPLYEIIGLDILMHEEGDKLDYIP
jgi:ammonia channel protein AmtB